MRMVDVVGGDDGCGCCLEGGCVGGGKGGVGVLRDWNVVLVALYHPTVRGSDGA